MEAHDSCPLPGCTLGRAHTGDHHGPRCPVCGVPTRWVTSQVAWYCRGGLCDHDGAIPAAATRQPIPAAPAVSPLAADYLAELDQYLLDLQAEAREHDEAARHHERLAVDARIRAAHLRDWRTKSPPAPTGASNTGRGHNP